VKKETVIIPRPLQVGDYVEVDTLKGGPIEGIICSLTSNDAGGLPAMILAPGMNDETGEEVIVIPMSSVAKIKRDLGMPRFDIKARE